MENDIYHLLTQVREKSPLVQNITNFVVMNNTANALLALGASPIMVHAEEELEEVLSFCNSVVINIGTLSKPWADNMILAAQIANKLGKPWVLDPVGAGISSLRNETLQALMLLKPTVIRGNASEIIALQNFNRKSVKGVDSTHSSSYALEAGKLLQKETGSIICISGATDYVISDNEITEIKNGTSVMTKVTGMGCTATAITGAFIGLAKHPYQEAVAGVAITSLAGELAAKISKGPGSLQLNFYDILFNLAKEQILGNLKIKRYANPS
ncbi:hydroxyethylthiazole kinase [Sphingobacterium mizutaii NBRC 14946 = DSM 11724]|uniref:Hydroxyethylthiazole kinase n=2 Tax=Sphingobacterium mizutaii TaxID=1010 RepID=A0AAJ4XEJ9_9SPHI|nr:hydroxyethylthiazole kinase [Sphingobacterium mizutaii]GEM67639.1 hydroxyethylthiazole kinase [Sphingobacterium mizutaii NBRC 14946 = DSM 11724]SDL15891.1 hydroxyethylthiazole kinase [Sphingobacterium mizutaii]SNV52588.1 Hydroxyethylthiazole kinase [Sphingobacterium mizutaii]